MRILTLSAHAQNGKDTIAEILKRKLELKNNKVLIFHYASYLKYLCREYFSWDGNKDEKGRTILQYVGTEIVRTRQPDFWVETAIRFFDLFGEDYDYIIIGDCRFLNEIEYLKNKYSWVRCLHIERKNFENTLTEEQRNHPSETSLDNYNFDYYLYPEEGIEELNNLIDDFIVEADL